MFLEHSTTEDQRQTRKYQFDSDQINLISSSANNTINNCSNNNNNNKTTKDDRIWQFLKYKFRSLSRSGDRVSDDNDDEQQFLSPSSTATTPTAERKSIKDRLHAKFSFTFRRRTSSKKLLTRKANSECHTALNYIGNKDNSSLIAQTSEDASGAKIAAQKRKQLLFKRQDRYSCGAVGGATIGSLQQQQNIPISCRIDTTFDKTPSSPTATKTIVNLSPAFEIGRRKNGIHFCSSVSHNGGNEIELDWSNRKFLTNRKSRDDYRLSDPAENFNDSEFETTERQNPTGRQVINALINGKTISAEESIYALSPTILDRKRSEKMNKEESTKPAASSLWPPRSDRHKNTDTVENSGGQHNTKLTVLLMNNVQARLETGADEAVQALTDAMSSLPSLSDSGSSTYYTPCTSSPARSPKISFSLRRNKNKSVFDMQQPSGTPSLENDKIALSPRLSFKKSSDKSPRPLRIIHPPQPTPSQNSIDQRQTKVVTWAVGSAKRPSLSRSFSTGSMTEQDAFPGDHSKNRTLSRSQDEERASWNISSDSTTSPDSGRKNVKSRKYPSSEASTSRLTVDSEGGDRLKKSSTASMKKKRSFADPIAKKLSFLRRRPTDVNLLQLARPGADERPSERDVRSWAECFDRLLQSSEGLKYFRLFLQREFSDENIEFWLACDHYKRIDDPQIRRKRSASIFKEFVAFQAPKEVNLDSSSRTATIELLNVKPDSVEVFDTAQYRIQSLMAKDSYPRFLRSDIYLNLITHARMAEQ